MIDQNDCNADIDEAIAQFNFKKSGIPPTDNTPDKDCNLVKEFSINAFRANLLNEPAPTISDVLVFAAQRTIIRAQLSGGKIVFPSELMDAISKKEANPLRQIGVEEMSTLDKIFTIKAPAP